MIRWLYLFPSSLFCVAAYACIIAILWIKKTGDLFDASSPNMLPCSGIEDDAGKKIKRYRTHGFGWQTLRSFMKQKAGLHYEQGIFKI